MSNPNINISNLDSRYSKPADVTAAINAQAATDAGQYAQKSRTGTKAVGQGEYVVNVKDYGAKGDGSTDDTAAIDAAGAASNSVYFPVGNFLYNGVGLAANPSNLGRTITGAGRGSTKITLGTGASLVTETSGTIAQLLVQGITFINGYGAVRLTSTQYSVQYPLIVRDCAFQSYTGAAISSLSADQPYWMITHNVFSAANDTSTIGVSINGDNAQSVIENNAFLSNGCHIKLGGTCGGAVKVTKNDFIRFGAYSTAPRIDLWLAMSGNSGGVAGGLVVSENKFGNENIDGRDYRVLIAQVDTSSSSDAALQRPLISAAASQYVSGALFTGNVWNGSSANGTAPYIVTTATLRDVVVRDLLCGGTVASYVIQYLFNPGDDSQATTNVIGPLIDADLGVNGDWSGFAVTNYPGNFTFIDNTGRLQDPLSPLITSGGGDPVGYVSIVSSASGFTWGKTGTASTASTSDAYSGSDAVIVTETANGDRVYSGFSNGLITAGIPVYIELDLKYAGVSPQAGMAVSMQYNGSNKWNRNFKISTDGIWRKFRFLYIPKTGTQVNQFTVYTTSATTGTFGVGRVRVYSAREPLNIDGRFPNTVIAPGGITTKTKAGTPTDADTTNPIDGSLIVDTSANKLWMRAGGSWINTGSSSTSSNAQVFSSSGTWTKPAGVTTVQFVCIGAGGGGGSGRKGASGTVRCGGGGGAGGSALMLTFAASDIPSTVSVSVGQGGAGGAAQATASSDGSNGTTGGNSGISFSGLSYTAFGGNKGSAGTATSGTNGSAQVGAMYQGGAGGTASSSGGSGGAASNPGVSSVAATGGGAGGGIGTGNTYTAGGQGGYQAWVTTAGNNPVNSDGANGTVATAFPTSISAGNYGGSGGASSVLSNGGNGGNGAYPGGGGGGSGAAVDGTGNSGTGGNGANGVVVVYAW